VTYLLHI